MQPYRAMLLAFILLPLALLAGGNRVDSETIISSTSDATPTAFTPIQFSKGGMLSDLTYFRANTNSPTQTAAVYRISYDLVVTNLITTVTSAGTNVFVSFAGTETQFRYQDLFTVVGVTGVTFRIRPTFVAYE
jgi:hypothetical protein